MNLVAFDIPDDAEQLPDWLEQHLLGLDLAQLVAELSAVHPSSGPTPALGNILGEQRDAVLRQGLRALSPRQVKQFLMYPTLLLDLQQAILTWGGPYWGRLPASVPMESALAQGREDLEAFLDSLDPTDPVATAAPPTLSPIAWYREPWFVCLATAAAVLLGVFVYEHTLSPLEQPVQTASAGWGWNKPGVVEAKVPANVYLDQLATAAHDWFNKRPADAASLAQRILEFRRGCAALIFAKHEPLDAKQQQWLRDKCRAWAEKLDKHLEALESGQDYLKVRNETDATINKLIDALHNEARQAVTG